MGMSSTAIKDPAEAAKRRAAEWEAAQVEDGFASALTFPSSVM
jgi:hypothetical protein